MGNKCHFQVFKCKAINKNEEVEEFVAENYGESSVFKTWSRKYNYTKGI